ncbi:hypothetical protein MKUB_20090 [Mycobacterium kubicae]|uniref:Ferredoxin n=1 Tax=Mycobacterium kubicae TaxID=120959 RepID=A0ABQ1BMJ8_9MYCO|nr:hypothetical protein MKUB_20090 [Mycobacterium kubicae]
MTLTVTWTECRPLVALELSCRICWACGAAAPEVPDAPEVPEVADDPDGCEVCDDPVLDFCPHPEMRVARSAMANSTAIAPSFGVLCE